MRGFLIWCMLALAIVARAEEEQVVLEDIDIDTLEVDNARVGRMLSELFDFTDKDDEEHDDELGINREARAKNEEASEVESKAVVEPEDQARYNKFMDTFFRRLNADARSTIDPMDVPLTAGNSRNAKKNGSKKGATKKDGANKNGAKKGAANKDSDKKDDADKKKKKKNQKKGKNKKSANKKSKKTGRHPKSLSLVEGEDETADEEMVDAEENHNIVTREVEEVEEIEEDEDEMGLERQERSVDLVEGDEDDVDNESAVARRIPENKKKAGKAGKKNAGKSKKGNNKRKNKNKNKNKNKSKAKRSAKKNDKKGKSNKPQTSKASVSGIASLKRFGDVQVVNRKDGKELRADFKMGPLSLKINRKFGSGKDAVMRSATANAPELTGKMHLYVAANGKAKITKFNIISPSIVTTDGSLNKEEGQRSGKNNFMEMSIARSTPFAAKKLKLAARAVLQATESKN